MSKVHGPDRMVTTALSATNDNSAKTLIRGLSLGDSVMLIVGGIIGSGVFLTAKDIASAVRIPSLFLLAWVFGGVVSLLACFAFAEMGAMYPTAGGQYVFLREAYGEFPAFLYGWMIFAVNNTGSIAALALGSAYYFGVLIPAVSASHVVVRYGSWSLNRTHLVAVATIAFLTCINVVGLRPAAILQNIATWAKGVAIIAFVGLGFLVGRGSWSHFSMSIPTTAHSPSIISGLGVSLIAVFWAYDGWVYVTWVGGEVKNPTRNVPRALLLGMMVVIVLYTMINAVYVYAMPLNTVSQQFTVAESAGAALFSPRVAFWLVGLVALSSFGAASSATLSGARVFYAMAEDRVFFRKLAEVHPRWRTPVFSLVLQGIWSVVLTVSGGYDELFTYVMFMMVISYGATVAALFILRRKRPDAPRPYRCTGYPVLPALYILISGAWALNTAWERPKEALAGGAIMLISLPAYFYWRRKKQEPTPAIVEATVE